MERYLSARAYAVAVPEIWFIRKKRAALVSCRSTVRATRLETKQRQGRRRHSTSWPLTGPSLGMIAASIA